MYVLACAGVCWLVLACFSMTPRERVGGGGVIGEVYENTEHYYFVKRLYCSFPRLSLISIYFMMNLLICRYEPSCRTVALRKKFC